MHAIELDRWDAWSPAEAAAWLNSCGVGWAVAGGWALELFVGASWRAHEDLEIAIDRASFDAVRDALPELDWFVAGDGELCPFELAGEMFEQRWQTWGRDPETGCWRIDVMREPRDCGQWLYRRDPTIRRALADAIASTREGIPYLAPEIVLLFKAKHCRAKDEEDFAYVLPHLNRDRRAWLTDTLSQVHPAHPWLAALSAHRTS